MNNNLRIFQREIYDFPSCFSVQNLGCDFFLSVFSFVPIWNLSICFINLKQIMCLNNNLRIFQREIYDFSSCFLVQNLGFDFFLLNTWNSSIRFIDLKQIMCLNNTLRKILFSRKKYFERRRKERPFFSRSNIISC